MRSFKSGRLIDARTFIERPLYSRLIRVRTKLKEALNRHETRLACTSCAVPVYLVAKTKNNFHFRHAKEDGSCPAVTRSALMVAAPSVSMPIAPMLPLIEDRPQHARWRES